MKSGDTRETVYCIAFAEKKFLMVWNPGRNGWEMPGGHIKEGETPVGGAKREFEEEAGFSVEIVGTESYQSCTVCAAKLGKRIDSKAEMEYGLFETLPEQLAFDRAEYEETVPWARKTIEGAD